MFCFGPALLRRLRILLGGVQNSRIISSRRHVWRNGCHAAVRDREAADCRAFHVEVSVSGSYTFPHSAKARLRATSNDSKEIKVLLQHARAVELTVVGDAAESGSPSMPAAGQLVDFILHSLDTDKAQDVVCIDLAGKSDMADHMVIASGRSMRQVVSISEKLIERLKHERGLLASVEGKEHGDWVLIDAGDTIIHIFRPEVREFYQLEKLWMTAVHDGPVG